MVRKILFNSEVKSKQKVVVPFACRIISSSMIFRESLVECRAIKKRSFYLDRDAFRIDLTVEEDLTKGGG